MGAATRQIRIGAPIDRVWGAISDFAHYPEFVPGVLACRVVGSGAGARHVEYEVDLGIRRVRYVLAVREEPPRRLAWSLLRGELFTRSDGSWELEEAEGATLARYTVEVEVARPLLVPRMVVERVVEEMTRIQLPRVLDAFRARAEGAA